MHSSPSRLSRILIYGHDGVLLKTRRLLLKEVGFQPDTANDAREFAMCIAQANLPYELFILCHTIPLAEQQAIRADAVNSSTAIYQLLVAAAPQDFVDTVSQLLP